MPDRILIADKFESDGIEALERLGATVDFQPGMTADDLPNVLAGVKILIVRSTKVTAAAFDAADALQLVVRAGAGVNTIDLAAASRKGIFVANCPGKNAAAVAELAMGLLIACDRRIPQATADLNAGNWNKKAFSDGGGLKGRTLGVIGLGTIGELVVTRAKAMAMRVAVWSRSLTSERADSLGVEYCQTPLDVAKQADAVSVHIALTPETTHIINKEFFNAMNPGAIFVNTSRGGTVDTAALLDAMNAKAIRAGLDVYENEPGSGASEFDFSIRNHPLFCGTPHIGASTHQAQQAIAAETVRIVREFVTTGIVPNCVNIAKKTPATHRLVVRHLDRPGVLAAVFDFLKTDGLNAQTIHNTIFEGYAAAVAAVDLDGAVSPETLEKMRAGAGVLWVDLLAIGG